MNDEIKVGDKVKAVDEHSKYDGFTGTVVGVEHTYGVVTVERDKPFRMTFSASHLVKIAPPQVPAPEQIECGKCDYLQVPTQCNYSYLTCCGCSLNQTCNRAGCHDRQPE